MAAIQLPSEIQNYKDEWVCITDDNRFGGHGKTPEEALADAEKNEEKNVTLFFAAKELWMEDMSLVGGRFIKITGTLK